MKEKVRTTKAIRVKDAALSVYGGTGWNFESMLADSADWPYGILDEMDAYKKVGLVRTCINVRSHYVLRNGYTLKVNPPNEKLEEWILEKNQYVDLNKVINVTLIKRQVWGRCGWEIVWTTDSDIDMLLALRSKAIRPEIDKDTQKVTGYNYPDAKGGKLGVNQVLYFTLDDLERDRMGLSGIISIKDSVNARVNLGRDLLESSKRLWAPMGIFKMNTERWQKPEDKQRQMEAFAASLKPGKSIVTNTGIEDAKIIDLKPDIQSLIRALENVDQDIMGFWMVPKAVLAREKTVTKATLSDAMKALYEGPVYSDQQYMKDELERQWYPKLVAIWKNRTNDLKDYKIEHIWKSQPFIDPLLLKAFAYAVKNKAIKREEMFIALPGLKMVKDGEELADKPKDEIEMLVEDAVEMGIEELAESIEGEDVTIVEEI